MDAKSCGQCGSSFGKKATTSRKDWETTRFCSKKCWYAWKSLNVIPWSKGLTKETDERLAKLAKKIREQFKNGRKIPIRTGESHHMFGKHHSTETKEKMSRAHSGANHWNWQEGKTDPVHRLRNQIRYQEWRLAVLEKDGGKCTVCASISRPNAHHIASFKDNPELRYDLENGRTLCNACHARHHMIERNK
mgnify:CR=1 FL=1